MTAASTKKNLTGSLILLLTATIWGFAFVAQSVGMDYIGGFTFNAIRFFMGALVLLPVTLFMNSAEKKKREKSGSSSGAAGGEESPALLTGGIVCGLFLFAASNFQQFGVKYTTVGKAGFITALYIVLVPIFGIFLHRKCGALVWAAVALAIAGLYLLCIKEEGFSLGKGEVLLICCAVLFAFQILAVDHYSPLVNGVKLAMIQFLVCGVCSAVPALLFEHPQLSHILEAWAPVLYAGLLSSGAGYTLQIIGQRDLDPTVASLIMSLESCISVLAGWLILHQSLSLREGLGCLIMFTAIILAQLKPDLMKKNKGRSIRPETHKKETSVI